MEEYALSLRNITKKFPGVTALDNVSANIRRGEIYALCGENGAGKSTLINILSGVYPFGTYEGEIYIDGKLQQFSGVVDAKNAEIFCVHQELALFPELSVTENIFMGNQPNSNGFIDWNKIYSGTEEYLKKLNLGVSINDKIKDLGAGQKQLVEIVKALVRNPKFLILDEPTSSLSELEVDMLLNLLRGLRENGVTCIYISHKLDEVLRISDDVMVLRDGKAVACLETAHTNKHDIISYMIGREMKDMFPREKHTTGELAFQIKDYCVANPDVPEKNKVEEINIEAYRGEILGICGLVGAGRTELFSSIFGTYGANPKGEVYIEGKKMNARHPYEALKEGYVLVTEDRKRYGLNLLMDVKENITLGCLKKVSKHSVLNKNLEIQGAEQYIKALRIKTPSFKTKAMNLSGGNQQKVVLAKSRVHLTAAVDTGGPGAMIVGHEHHDVRWAACCSFGCSVNEGRGGDCGKRLAAAIPICHPCS